ncbi:MAG TPA: imidazole glycerol phosphate synthase subunit HisH [Gammaproteobacteria bacterium]|nr:imidazole glycerol phosphate synthase subunit HisH [Gammaproteobacteria bacterium]
MQTVAVIDYGMSNLRSVAKALEFAAVGEHRIVVSNEADAILNADRVVFPGQGAMGTCMRNLREQALLEVVSEAICAKPFLGICLGLQSLMETSDEDSGQQGLGVLRGRVVRFSQAMTDARGERLKVPHMGWNQVTQAKKHPLWTGIPSGAYFYFVHSYYVQPQDGNVVTGTTDYGVNFVSAVARSNYFATQFHPEKSQKAGIALLKNFLAWDGG